MRTTHALFLVSIPLVLLSFSASYAQDQSVRPGINKAFEKPVPTEFLERFETESREIFAQRAEIVKAVDCKPGTVVADIGAGTGLFTRLFAKATGPTGKVVAVDIAQSFLDHVVTTCHAENLNNVETQLCNQESCLLAPNSIDLAFVCDTYHHFEFPFKTMQSILKALKPSGRIVLIDLHRIEGVSSDWAINHVRANMETVQREIESNGFKRVSKQDAGLKENYFLVFQKSDANSKPTIHQAMETFVASNDIAGAVTLVVSPDAILHLDATGFSDIANKTSMRTDSIHWIASMSKPVTAACVMMMVDEGKLALEDPITKFLPQMSDVKNSDGESVTITVEQLLNHTSGMSEIGGGQAYADPNLAAAAEKYAKLPVQFKPGSKWQYSQTGINTAARIVEVVSGKTFELFVEERLCKPLGMKDTTFYLTDSQLPRLAKSYSKESDGTLKEAEIRLLSGKLPTDRDRLPAANGGLFSTAEDYGRFCQMLLNDGKWMGRSILLAKSVARMNTPTTGDLKTGFTVGNAWGVGCCIVREPQGVSETLSPGSYGHGGAYGTQAWIDPVKKRAYILMVQRANFPNSDNSEVRIEFQRLAAQLNN